LEGSLDHFVLEKIWLVKLCDLNTKPLSYTKVFSLPSDFVTKLTQAAGPSSNGFLVSCLSGKFMNVDVPSQVKASIDVTRNVCFNFYNCHRLKNSLRTTFSYK